MKTFVVKVDYMNDKGENVLYSKYYAIKAESADMAEAVVFNGLSLLEFHNYEVAEVKEVSKC